MALRIYYSIGEKLCALNLKLKARLIFRVLGLILKLLRGDAGFPEPFSLTSNGPISYFAAHL